MRSICQAQAWCLAAQTDAVRRPKGQHFSIDWPRKECSSVHESSCKRATTHMIVTNSQVGLLLTWGVFTPTTSQESRTRQPSPIKVDWLCGGASTWNRRQSAQEARHPDHLYDLPQPYVKDRSSHFKTGDWKRCSRMHILSCDVKGVPPVQQHVFGLACF